MKPQEEKTCVICGTPFYSKWKLKRTCSTPCMYKLKSQKNSKITRICVVCRKEFEIWPAWLRKNGERGMYCSPECHFANKYKYTDKEKQTARNKITHGLQNGTIKQELCKICGEKETQAHHHKGYAKEHQLDIIWLCKKHHLEEHERLRRYGLINYL